jgi:outer membrane protein, heavy metal efflux system
MDELRTEYDPPTSSLVAIPHYAPAFEANRAIVSFLFCLTLTAGGCVSDRANPPRPVASSTANSVPNGRVLSAPTLSSVPSDTTVTCAEYQREAANGLPGDGTRTALFDSPPSTANIPAQSTLPRTLPARAANSEVVGAPVLIPRPQLTFDQAINTCLNNDPKFRIGVQAVQQANADALTASLLPNPQLFTDGQLLPFNGSFTPATQGGPTQQDVNLIFPVDWFLFGKRAAAMASAGIGAHATEAEYADLIRQRIRDTAIAFYDVLEAKALLEFAHQDTQNSEAILTKASRNKDTNELELNRARIDLLTAKRAESDAQATLIKCFAHLRALLGQTESDPGFDVSGCLAAPLTTEPLPIDQALAVAVQNRPDIGALRIRVDAQRAGAHSEDRKAYPTVVTQLGYTHQYQESLGFPDANSWNTAVTMAVPLFDRNQGNRAKATSAVIQAQEELRSGEVELRAELEAAIQELHTARETALSVEQEQLKLESAVRDSVRHSFETDKASMADMLEAEHEYRDTYRLFITSRADYWRALFKFDAAIGQQCVK